MPKRFNTKIGSRDIDILSAIERCPLTVNQLCKTSQTFACPFRDTHNLRRRLRSLTNAGLICSWPYAIASNGQSPRYFKLTRDGYRLMHGQDVALPQRRFFEEISHGHHRHTFSLSEVVVHLSTTAHANRIGLRHFSRENSLKLEAAGFTMYPDCAFQLVTADGRGFNFVVELDNGTERIRTRQDVESIERKLRGYDAHQSQFAANNPSRYQVLFITTRSDQRTQHILDLADLVMQNRQRTVFLGCGLSAFLESNPHDQPLFRDHRHLRRTLVPLSRGEHKNAATSMTAVAVS